MVDNIRSAISSSREFLAAVERWRMNIRPFLISNIRTETQLVQSFPAGYQKEKMSDYSAGYNLLKRPDYLADIRCIPSLNWPVCGIPFWRGWRSTARRLAPSPSPPPPSAYPAAAGTGSPGHNNHLYTTSNDAWILTTPVRHLVRPDKKLIFRNECMLHNSEGM